jgi:hypothetical protein
MVDIPAVRPAAELVACGALARRGQSGCPSPLFEFAPNPKRSASALGRRKIPPVKKSLALPPKIRTVQTHMRAHLLKNHTAFSAGCLRATVGNRREGTLPCHPPVAMDSLTSLPNCEKRSTLLGLESCAAKAKGAPKPQARLTTQSTNSCSLTPLRHRHPACFCLIAAGRQDAKKCKGPLCRLNSGGRNPEN